MEITVNKRGEDIILPQRVEKVFLIRCRLLRKVLNFVFLRRKMYDGTSTEQKTKNAKSTANSIFAVLFFVSSAKTKPPVQPGEMKS
ncbi:MAG: hypothetical protein Q4C99_08275, partial [Clostridia bacterium]|nr:hypothetical protein [Clostridia bacterium]